MFMITDNKNLPTAFKHFQRNLSIMKITLFVIKVFVLILTAMLMQYNGINNTQIRVIAEAGLLLSSIIITDRQKTQKRAAVITSSGTLWKYHGTISSFLGLLPATDISAMNETIMATKARIPIT